MKVTTNKLIIAGLIFIATLCSSYASKEGILLLSSFRIESDGIGSSGKIAVEGRQEQQEDLQSHFLELKVTAFDKTYSLPKEKLDLLTGASANGIRISYETGYEKTGGRTIYIQFQTGFTSFTRKQVLVTLTENGNFEIRKIEKIEK
jgi:hypothetical protein